MKCEAFFIVSEWLSFGGKIKNSKQKYESFWAKIGKTTIWESKKQKILGVEMNNAFSFHEYVASSCKKAGKKLCVQIRKTF